MYEVIVFLGLAFLKPFQVPFGINEKRWIFLESIYINTIMNKGVSRYYKEDMTVHNFKAENNVLMCICIFKHL